jgi:predicted NAD-dependent protein-ADP-ribosyltransferase YbiA (DUF1768 family)
MTTTAVLPAIASFTGEFEFLSNFSRAGGLIPVEYYFQARKAVTSEGAEWVMSAPSAGEAKRRGRQVRLVNGWETRKRAVMLDLIMEKFSVPELAARLGETRGRVLIEGNSWGDYFWGAGGPHAPRLGRRERPDADRA